VIPAPSESDRPADTVGGILSAIAITAALFSLAYKPVRLDVFAIVVSFVAVGIGGRHSRLAAAAVAIASICFVAGMVIAVFTERSLY
jgi:hypothetical protein